MDISLTEDTIFSDSLSNNYKEIELHQCPPNGPGITVLIMMAILEKFNLRIINLSEQNKNLEHFSTYNTFKKTINHFSNEKITIFDVGANTGSISKIFLKYFCAIISLAT